MKTELTNEQFVKSKFPAAKAEAQHLQGVPYFIIDYGVPGKPCAFGQTEEEAWLDARNTCFIKRVPKIKKMGRNQ